MNNHTSDTEISIPNGKPAEQGMENSIHPETTTSHAQNNITNQTQIVEKSKPEVLPSQQHKNLRGYT